jgi:hypothetical protein
MSNTQYAFLDRSRVPTRELLQASIDALGFDLKLHPALDLLNDAGFSPCVLYGIPDVGFELFSEPAADVIGDNEEFKEAIGTRDFSLSMVWRGSMKDCAAVMIVSYALAKDFGAAISYEGEPPEPLESLLQALPEIIAEAKVER